MDILDSVMEMIGVLAFAVSGALVAVLICGGQGGGLAFNWELIGNLRRPYFLAGGLDCENVTDAIATLSPYGVDVSSGIETGGIKDPEKMRKFVMTVRSMMLEN